MGTSKYKEHKSDGGFCSRTIPVIPLDWQAEMNWEIQRAKHTGKVRHLSPDEIKAYEKELKERDNA